MDESKIKYVIEAALLAAGRPLTIEKLASLFATKAAELDRSILENALAALSSDYKERGLELKEVSSGYRLQIKSSMSEWLTPLWEERAPRYTRALLETLALVAYRQPITRGEIEEVRGVAVSTNIMRTLLERNWVRVVGHRDVPGKPEMFGTTREFLDYFGLKRLEDLPPLADIKDGLPELSPQSDLIDALDIGDDVNLEDAAEAEAGGGEIQVIVSNASASTDEASEVDGDGEAERDDTPGLDQAPMRIDEESLEGLGEARSALDKSGLVDDAVDEDESEPDGDADEHEEAIDASDDAVENAEAVGEGDEHQEMVGDADEHSMPIGSDDDDGSGIEDESVLDDDVVMEDEDENLLDDDVATEDEDESVLDDDAVMENEDESLLDAESAIENEDESVLDEDAAIEDEEEGALDENEDDDAAIASPLSRTESN